MREYGELKKRLAQRFPDDIDSYVDGKTTMLLTMLRATGFPAEQLRQIERANRKYNLKLGSHSTIRKDHKGHKDGKISRKAAKAQGEDDF